MSKALSMYLIISAFVLGFLVALCGVYVNNNRAPEPKIVLHSPALGDMPAPNQVVEVRYGWGCAYARYLKGDESLKDIWLEYNYLEDGEAAAMDLGEVFGVPIYWWTPPEIPDGLKESL